MKNQELVSISNVKNPRVNKKIRICIECGIPSLRPENNGVYCKSCKKFFNFKEDEKWVKIPAGVFAGIMM